MDEGRGFCSESVPQAVGLASDGLVRCEDAGGGGAGRGKERSVCGRLLEEQLREMEASIMELSHSLSLRSASLKCEQRGAADGHSERDVLRQSERETERGRS